jgi:hypothetical protein
MPPPPPLLLMVPIIIALLKPHRILIQPRYDPLPPRSSVVRYGEPRVGLKQAQAAATTAPSEANTAAAAVNFHAGATSNSDDIRVSTDCPCWYGVDACILALYVFGN